MTWQHVEGEAGDPVLQIRTTHEQHDREIINEHLEAAAEDLAMKAKVCAIACFQLVLTPAEPTLVLLYY